MPEWYKRKVIQRPGYETSSIYDKPEKIHYELNLPDFKLSAGTDMRDIMLNAWDRQREKEQEYQTYYNEYLKQNPTKPFEYGLYDPELGMSNNPIALKSEEAHKYAAEKSGYTHAPNPRDAWKEGEKLQTQVAAGVAATPILLEASAGAFGLLPEVATNLKFGYDGYKALRSPEGIAKTINFVKEGRIGRAAWSGLGDLFDAGLFTGGVKSTGKFLGKYGGLAREVLDATKFNIGNKGTGFRMFYPWQDIKSANKTLELVPQYNSAQIPGHFGKVKYYGPTMGKTTAVATNSNLVDFDDIIRDPSRNILDRFGFKSKSDMYNSGNQEAIKAYEDMLVKQLRDWRGNPLNEGKTLVASPTAIANPEKTGFYFDNVPSIPSRDVFISRNVARGGKPESSAMWYNSLMEQNPNLKIDDRFVSQIEYQAPQTIIKSIFPQTAYAAEVPEYSRWTDAQWDEAYNAAVQSGNMDEAQRLRDLHFKTKAPDTKIINKDGSLIHMIHGSPVKFTEFRSGGPGGTSGRGVYFGKAPEDMSKWVYGGKNGYKYPVYLNAKSIYDGSLLREKDASGKIIYKDIVNSIIGANSYDQFLNDMDVLSKNYPDWLMQGLKRIDEDTYKRIHDKYDVKGLFKADKHVKKHLFRKNDEYVTLDPEFIGEIVVRDPRQIKLSDAITYDDAGNIIPLSQRDNFENPDIRFSLEEDFPVESIPLWKRIPSVIRKAQDDLKAMNPYHVANVEEYNRTFGTNFKPVSFRTDVGASKIMSRPKFIQMLKEAKTNSPGGDLEKVGGYYDVVNDQVALPDDARSYGAYHEFLHQGMYGLRNPQVTRWRIGQLIDPKRIEHLNPRQISYYLSEIEFPVYLRQMGENMNINVGDPYPGDEVFDQMLLDNPIIGSANYVKRDTPEEKQLFWRALNGTLFGGLGAAAVSREKNGGILKFQKAGLLPKLRALASKVKGTSSTLEVYHRSPIKFDIEHFYKGTPYDFGLHAGTPSESLGDMVYKLKIPKPTVKTLDLHANNWNHLDNDYVFQGRQDPGYYDSNPDEKWMFLKEYIRNPKNWGKKIPQFKDRGDGVYIRIQPDDFHFNIRRRIAKHLTPEQLETFNSEADKILDQGKYIDEQKNKSYTSRMSEVLKENAKALNAQTSDLLHKYGIDVLEYPNHNFMEGQRPSYIITDPSAIKSWTLEE